MSQPYSTGPCFCSVNPGRDRAFYLGTPERPADMDLRPYYEDCMNDLAGSKIQFDIMYVGQDAMITFDLTVWNADTLEACKSFALPGIGTPGTDAALDRGTLMLTEERSYELWIDYPRSLLPAMSTLVRGYHFFNVYLMGPHKMNPGVKPYKERCIFHALGKYDFGTRRFSVYDHDMDGQATPN